MEIIKEALELLGDNKELQSAESCSTSTPSSVSYMIFIFVSGTCKFGQDSCN